MMTTAWSNEIRNIAIEELMKSPVGEKLQLAANTLETIQKNLCALSDQQDELGIIGIKAITILTFAMMKKMAEGKRPSEFGRDDWKDIAKAISDYAVIGDGQLYSMLIFGMYERYILTSAAVMKNFVPPDVTDSIQKLAEELHQKSEALKSNQMTEAAYTEDCLWISLEAMVKLIASVAILSGNKESAELAQAVSDYALAYGRMVLYQKELQIISEYLEDQKQLDQELEKKYSEFLEELQKQTSQFQTLIDHAFAANFRDSYLASIKLALSAGVPENEVLKTEEDIDDFFLN